jgi:hypothetical protein
MLPSAVFTAAKAGCLALRHHAQRGFVQLKVDRHALARGGMAVGGSQAHAVDALPSICGHLRGVQCVVPHREVIAQQDDRSRFLGAWRQWRDLLVDNSGARL